ncbi:MAG: Uma2 family endonuclease [Phototrophicales bacterium]|nr:Uma2 family endonuclease [Phototrophicales bacterium]
MTLEMQAKKTMTIAEFDAWMDELGNTTDTQYEYIHGEVYEVASNLYASKIGMRMGGFIFIYLMQNDIGHLTGADGGYKVGDERFVPDVGYISYTRQAELSARGYNAFPPELAIEVVSNTDNKTEWKKLLKKINSYINADVMVWVVDTDDKTIDIYQRGEEVKTVGINDMLETETIFPNFRLKVADIFA